jgi:hypothetical protein
MAYYVPKNLFNIDANPKTIKGQKLGFRTMVLYMAPHKLSGQNFCPMAEIAGCVEACLNTAGNPAYAKTKEKARLNKARYFIENEQAFMRQVMREIEREHKKALRDNVTLLVRLNGTTDIRWENIRVDGKTIFEHFPLVQFYDYTKIANRKDIPANYDLTFSYSGILAYQPFVKTAIKSGLRVAVVFRDKKKIPASFIGLPVVSGDDSDVRHIDPQGVVVALYAKGKAKTDNSGFVVDAPVFQLAVA